LCSGEQDTLQTLSPAEQAQARMEIYGLYDLPTLQPHARQAICNESDACCELRTAMSTESGSALHAHAVDEAAQPVQDHESADEQQSPNLCIRVFHEHQLAEPTGLPDACMTDSEEPVRVDEDGRAWQCIMIGLA
jgi:hypothetical protein